MNEIDTESVELDLSKFMVPPPVVAGVGDRGAAKERRRQDFISRIPMPWAVRAASVVAPISSVLLAIRYLNGFKPGQPFEATLSRLTLGLVSLDAARRALHRLEEERLIHVERRPGRKLRITVLELG